MRLNPFRRRLVVREHEHVHAHEHEHLYERDRTTPAYTHDTRYALRHPLRSAYTREPAYDVGDGRSFALDVMIPGGIAGTIGGAVMAFVYMCLSAGFGHGFWTLPKLIAGVFFRYVPPNEMGLGSVLLGLALHFLIAGGIGTVFALIIPRGGQTMFATAPLGIFYALVMYVVMNYFVANVTDPTFRRELMHAPWWLAHFLFGFCLSIIQPMRRGRTLYYEGLPTFWQRDVRA